MSPNTNAAINAAAQAAGVECHEPEKNCPYCERKGLPILPVRYAVCENSQDNEAIDALPESRTGAFTDVALNESKYILRQLRPGYFYLFDPENSLRWYAYRVTQDGLFEQFNVLNPEKYIEKDNHCANNQNKMLHASLITLPTVDTSAAIYWAYTEYPWPESLIRRLGEDSAAGETLRQKMMQKIDNIQDWINDQNGIEHAFDAEQLHWIAEYSPGASAVEGHFWGKGAERKLFTTDDMQAAMQSHLDHADSRWRGLILGVKDEIGVITELNAYRHQVAGEMEDFFETGDNKRLALCCDVIDAMDKGFKTAREKQITDEAAGKAKALNERYSSASGPGLRASLEEQLAEARQASDTDKVEQLQRLIDYSERNGHFERSPYPEARRGHQAQLAGIEREKAHALGNIEDEYQDYLEELRQYYDINAYEDFVNDELKPQKERVDSALAPYDADYAAWVSAHLMDAIERYDRDNFWCGIGLCIAAEGALHGGAMGEASSAVWLDFARHIDDADSPILRLLFANSATLQEDALASYAGLAEGAWFDESALTQWKTKYRDLYEAQYANRLSEGGIGDTPQTLATHYDVVNGKLFALIGNAFFALAVQDAAGHEAASGAGDRAQAYLRFTQLSRMGSSDIQFADAPLPLFKTVTLTLTEYHYWLDLVQRYGGKRGESSLDDTSGDATKNREESEGNFAIPYVTDDTTVEVAMPLDASDRLVHLTQGLPDNVFNTDALDARYTDLTESALGIASKIVSQNPAMVPYMKGYSAWSSVDIIRQYFSEDKGDDVALTKVMGAAAGISGLAMELAGKSAFLQYHAAMAGLVNQATRQAWKLVSGTISVVGDVLSFYDGLMKLSDAMHDQNLGRSTRSVRLQYALGGTIITGASIGLLGLSLSAAGIAGATSPIGLALVAIGLIIGAIGIALGFAATKLVSTATMVWLNRCYIGRQYDTQLAPFASIEQEQSSLDLLSQGVAIELTREEYQETRVTGETGPLGEIVNRKRVRIKARVPNLSKMELSLMLQTTSGILSEEIFNDAFVKEDGVFEIESADQGGIRISESSEYTVSQGDGSYTIERSVDLPNSNSLNSVRFEVEFLDRRARTLTYRDVFNMEVS